MKRTYISPEHIYIRTNGTNLMKEQKSFLGSKMMDIEDLIVIDNRSVSYYQSVINEQISIASELLLQPIIYSFDIDKKENHSIVMSEKQSALDKERNTNWDIKINIKTILRNYIFANIKYNRTFEGVLNTMTFNNDINLAITDYINSNIINRYKFKSLDFYVKYNSLTNNNSYRYITTYDTNIISDTYKTSKILASVDNDYNIINATFRQDKPSNEYNFNYYFTIIFEKA